MTTNALVYDVLHGLFKHCYPKNEFAAELTALARGRGVLPSSDPEWIWARMSVILSFLTGLGLFAYFYPMAHQAALIGLLLHLIVCASYYLWRRGKQWQRLLDPQRAWEPYGLGLYLIEVSIDAEFQLLAKWNRDSYQIWFRNQPSDLDATMATFLYLEEELDRWTEWMLPCIFERLNRGLKTESIDHIQRMASCLKRASTTAHQLMLVFVDQAHGMRPRDHYSVKKAVDVANQLRDIRQELDSLLEVSHS